MCSIDRLNVRLVAALVLGLLLSSALGCGSGTWPSRKAFLARASRLSRLEFGAKGAVVSEELLKSPPVWIAILPFRSGTKELGKITGLRLRRGAERVAYEQEILARTRRQFYGYFSPREFRDLEIMLIDRILEREGISSEELDEVSPQRLGSLLHADALIYGDVTQFRVLYLGLFVRVSVGLDMRMVSAHTGNVLWQVLDVRSKNRITASIDPIAVVLGVYQNALEVTSGHSARTVDFLCEKIVATIPEVAQGSGSDSSF